MSLETTPADDPAEESESRLLRCVRCGNLCAGVATEAGELVPASRRRCDQCPTCAGDEFEQVSLDLLWRKGFRSVTHCYSGCGAGEMVGVVVLAGVLAITSMLVTSVVTFILAYVFGFALTIGPTMQEGIGFNEALTDALYSETASIAVMEIVAIGVDVWFARSSSITSLTFWIALVLSLSIGYFAAYPVNVFLVSRGIKGGMADPTQQGQAT